MLACATWEEQDSCRKLKIKTGKQLEKIKAAGKPRPSQSASLRADFARLEISREDREADWAICRVGAGNMLRLDQPAILAPIALLMGNRIADVPWFTRRRNSRDLPKDFPPWEEVLAVKYAVDWMDTRGGLCHRKRSMLFMVIQPARDRVRRCPAWRYPR
jgi:hypothetical protein